MDQDQSSAEIISNIHVLGKNYRAETKNTDVSDDIIIWGDNKRELEEKLEK